MVEINRTYKKDKKLESITGNLINNDEFYLKYGSFINRGCWHVDSSEGPEKEFRYANFQDKTGLVKASWRYKLKGMEKDSRNPNLWKNCNFDHTTCWRYPGKHRQGVVLLNEPYDISNIKRLELLVDISDLEMKVFDPSEKSLWYPNGTYMIFIWCPDHTIFDPSWISHPDWSDLQNTLKYSNESHKLKSSD